MKATTLLHDLGQSLWLDNITRDLLNGGKALAAPFTIDTMPEATLRALSEQTELGSIMAEDGVSCEEVLAELTDVGIDIDTLADRLQEEGAKSFAKSWSSLIAVIASKREPVAKAA